MTPDLGIQVVTSRPVLASRLLAVDRSPRFLRAMASVVPLTILLGATVAISWLTFGGIEAFGGPFRAFQEDWPGIYGSQALLAAIVGFVAAPSLATRFGRRGSVLAIVAAWIGEFLALTVGGRILANELVPEVGWLFWLMATGGPLQPIAAMVGMWFGWRRGRTPQAPMAEAISSRPS